MSYFYRQKGFTLIELMIVILLIAVISAIGFSSYQQFVIKNSESSAKSQMGQIELQLERWKASSLSYRGFEPMRGMDSNNNPTFGYDANNTLIFVPFGSDANNFRYQIELFDGSTNNTSLVSSGSDIDIGTGRSWVMIARPNPDGVAGERGKVFVQRSTGMKCATPVFTSAANDAATITNCGGTNWETW